MVSSNRSELDAPLLTPHPHLGQRYSETPLRTNWISQGSSSFLFLPSVGFQNAHLHTSADLFSSPLDKMTRPWGNPQETPGISHPEGRPGCDPGSRALATFRPHLSLTYSFVLFLFILFCFTTFQRHCLREKSQHCFIFSSLT